MGRWEKEGRREGRDREESEIRAGRGESRGARGRTERA